MANNKRKSWLYTIQRWFGLQAESANEALDNMVDVETQLNRKLRELEEQHKTISTSPQLARALGLATQLEDELVRENKSYGQAKYESTIKTLMQGNKREEARQVLLQKQKHEQKIQMIKDNFKTAQMSRDKMQDDLKILQTNMEKVRADLEELKQRNRYASQTEEIYDLMNEISSIDTSYDSGNIRNAIEERERQVAGKRIIHDNNNVVSNAHHQAQMNDLDSQLDQYL